MAPTIPSPRVLAPEFRELADAVMKEAGGTPEAALELLDVLGRYAQLTKQEMLRTGESGPVWIWVERIGSEIRVEATTHTSAEESPWPERGGLEMVLVVEPTAQA